MRRPFFVRRANATEARGGDYFLFAALFLAPLRAVLRLEDFRADRFVDFLAARFFAPPLRAVLRFVDFFAARFFAPPLRAVLRVDFFAARFFVALRLVDFFAADFFGAAFRFFARFFGAEAGAEGVIIDIMSAIIVASPV
jgi:hypothetical protein